MKIRYYRQQKEMTQYELAKALGVTVSLISKYEAGVVVPPKKRLIAIAEILGVKTTDLYDEEDFYATDNQTYTEPRSQVHKLTLPAKRLLQRMLINEANKCCELCGNPAPFNDKDGRPYLALYNTSEGYPSNDPTMDFVVLCPNCLARVQICEEENIIKKLREKARNHNY